MNEEQLRKALGERGMKKEDIDLIVKQASAEAPKQVIEPAKEADEGSQKQEGGEPEPVKDKREGDCPDPENAPNPEGDGVGGGEPKPTPNAGSADDERFAALEAKVNDVIKANEAKDAKIEAYEKLLAKMGLALNGDDPKPFGVTPEDGSKEPDRKSDKEANIKEINSYLGYVSR